MNLHVAASSKAAASRKAAAGRLASLAMLAAVAPACSDYELVRKEANDVFYQEPAGEADILIVMDNSCSMQPYQARLADNFNPFLSYLEEAQVEYQIGVVTTTIEVPTEPYGACTGADYSAIPEGGHLVDSTWIDNDTVDAETVFGDLVQGGVCGNGYEMGLESAYRAMTPPISIEENLGFLRDSAVLSMIFVSDEEDASPLGVNRYLNEFRSVKGFDERDAYNASALAVLDEQDCAEQVRQGSTEGSRYVDIAEQTDGITASICQEDFESILTDISLRASRLVDEFYLTVLPNPGSLEVYILEDGDYVTEDEEGDDAEAEPIPCDDGVWTYELEDPDTDPRAVIIFDLASLPPPKSKIVVRYDYGDGDPELFCTGDSDDGSDEGSDEGGE